MFQLKFCAFWLSTLSQDATPSSGAVALYVPVFQHASMLVNASVLNLTNGFDAILVNFQN